MISEWMKVMLEEIARKKAEEEQARIEEQRRAQAHGQQHGQHGQPDEVPGRSP
jgi:hypothetical protein